MIKGRGLSPGRVSAEVIVCDQFISPLGEISREGLVTTGPCSNSSITGKILAFKGGRGSTVGSYTFLELKTNNIAPAGLINESAEGMVVTGAIISDIPMVDGVPLDVLVNGDWITLDGNSGEVAISNVEEKRVTTVFLMHGESLLVLKRSSESSSYAGQFGGISGYIEEGETPEETGRREMMEEIGIRDAVLRRTGKNIYVRSDGIIYEITPLLMYTESVDVKLNEENSSFHWAKHDDLKSYDTVPKFSETLEALLNQT